MCGIFAVLREEAERVTPSPRQIEAELSSVAGSFASGNGFSAMCDAAAGLCALDEMLSGTPGVRALVAVPGLMADIEGLLTTVTARVEAVEADLDAGRLPGDASLEEFNEVIVTVRDKTWSIVRDRLRTARCVIEMMGDTAASDTSAIDAYTSVQMALSAIDRLEVRGRDSAGISVLVYDHGIGAEQLEEMTASRRDTLFLDNAVESEGETAVFVYKAAAEIGALGDNVAHLRAGVTRDQLLREVLQRNGVKATVVSHTRWASVGTVSQANAHPVDSQMPDCPSPYVVASLNGDVDNFVRLRHVNSISCATEITTDAKVIPTLLSRRLLDNGDVADAFRSVVAEFDGSVAIEVAVASEPDRLLLAVRGSGQGCYVGLVENAFLVASEPYGLVEQCDTYLRIDGETPSATSGKNGQVVELRASGAGTLQALRRLSYGGEELPVSESELTRTEITTRDIDRGDAPHFLLKEISESPESVRRTLRGKISGSAGRSSVSLTEESFPEALHKALASGQLSRVIAIGQGTAAVAARSVMSVLEHLAPAGLAVSVRPATELSGFGLRDDMSDTLVVAVSQSGTTTDTNRTVDLARSRGARVIAIVNRRESDLTEKADGVLYTSDGRDVEMSVASTKAFYAQVVAGTLLGIAIADATGSGDRRQMHDLLDGLKRLPSAMTEVLAKRDEISRAARAHGPSRRWWAVVGNGPNHIAAQELRIKMSELCYKSIAYDVTEDKKHIDLSSEPMIFVCAAGVTDRVANDVAKEVAIFKAHKALPIVVCSEGTTFDAPSVITVPVVHPGLDFVLSTMVGHLFGYEAALAVDEQGQLMRATRAIVDDVIALSGQDEEQTFASLRSAISEQARVVLRTLSSGDLDGHLTSSTAVGLAGLLRCASGLMTLDAFEVETGRPMSPLLMIEELMSVLSLAVDELTRPIDAVKHQAKTVTVGISRTEDSHTDNTLVDAVVGSGASRQMLSYRNLRLLSALVPAVLRVNGFTRYGVTGDVAGRTATTRVIEKGGVARDIVSRSESDPRLSGTKHRVAYERTVTVARGGRDGRPVIIVPETRDTVTTGIVLLHVDFADALSPDVARNVLTGYRGRYAALVDAVTETEPDFDDSVLARIAILDLLVEPVRVLAGNWRQR